MSSPILISRYFSPVDTNPKSLKSSHTATEAPSSTTADCEDSQEVIIVESESNPTSSFTLSKPPPFPTTLAERAAFVREPREGIKSTKVTAFQWRLYDLLLQVPPGKVSTYGQLSTILSSSPRAVGSALRNNPFAPFVPCHRIIASNGYIGGFAGEWNSTTSSSSKAISTSKKESPSVGGKKKKKESKKGDSQVEQGPKVTEKLNMLKSEGVKFDHKGYLKDKSNWWKGI